MWQQTWSRAAGVLALCIAVNTGVFAAGAEVPTERNPGAGRLPVDAARLYGFVTTPHPGELKWQQIPWLTDLQEGIREAKAERRPLLLFVSGDDPLEKC
jgi:hypothetical protein